MKQRGQTVMVWTSVRGGRVNISVISAEVGSGSQEVWRKSKGEILGLEEDEDAEDRVGWRRKLLGLRSRESIQLAGEP